MLRLTLSVPVALVMAAIMIGCGGEQAPSAPGGDRERLMAAYATSR